MDQLILSDANEVPTEKVIFSHIGKTKPLWISLFEHIHKNYPEFAEEWRYYRDGKSWLMKVTQKKKTIFWLGVIEGAFRTTFYFTDKAEEALMSSDLSEELKEKFQGAHQSGKIRGATVVYATKKDVEDAKILIGIKLQMK